MAIEVEDIAANPTTTLAARAAFKPTFFAKAKGAKAGELYIYNDIGGGFFGGISAQDVAESLKSLGQIETLDIYVNSPGGDVFEGIAIYNQLKRLKATKNVYIDGLAASIASVICMAGDKICCASNAMMMIHNPYGMCMGTSEDMRATADVLDQVRDQLVDTYATRSGEDKAKISDWMNAETWWKADDAKACGFVDEVTDDTMDAQNMAFALLAKFKKTPEPLAAKSRSSNVLIAKMNMSKNLRNALEKKAS
jgi:ATP-dependent Clp protease protease subunit